MGNQEIILDIDRLTKKYGGKKAVDSLSLQIHRGEISDSRPQRRWKDYDDQMLLRFAL